MKQRVLFVIWIITVTLMLLAACSNGSEDGTGFRIDFGAVGYDHWDISNVKMEYDVNALKKRISGDNAFVYGRAVLRQPQIISQIVQPKKEL